MSDKTDLYDLCRTEVREYVEEFRLLVADGLSFADVRRILVLAVKKAHDIFHEVPDSTPAEQDEAILRAVSKMYDELIRPKQIPGVPASWQSYVHDTAENGMLRACEMTLYGIRLAAK